VHPRARAAKDTVATRHELLTIQHVNQHDNHRHSGCSARIIPHRARVRRHNLDHITIEYCPLSTPVSPTRDRKQQRPAQIAHTPLAVLCHSRCRLSAVRHYDCDIPNNRTGVALVRSTDSRRSPPPQPTTHALRNTALPATQQQCTRVGGATRCDKPHPAQRHGSVMARVTQNNARPQPTQRTSHTHMQNTDTQAPHARTTSRTAPTTAQ
jgi:hypothetical protein